ncbi:RsmD family RNA methyltransferase [Psychroflexus sediminis]|uniref:16S rRNA (Guanine(966)-N(2))-methyltransferase RsmD n=1 Tax=Psychroflexus sediminis TaxID=470826 RepID=A0A1G7Y9G8_9FLAO|nr:RsmD family RNA methyltransferase [Psychroflexus sediminis]SDG92966.1 16S rRNA (guanine(966)-N(2))-methyltransferase RsmD [Psychroflexus sediminis]
MRIVSGRLKGRRLIAPKKLPVRPTTDMAKEALFNILNNRIRFQELEVIDLFAGIGSISFEFISRGTQRVTAVDANIDCIKFLTKTSEELDLDLDIIKSDVFEFLEKTTLKADLIFADPPYDLPTEEFEKIENIIRERSLLNEEGVLIIEHSKHTSLQHINTYSEQRKYGNSVFSFFKTQS